MNRKEIVEGNVHAVPLRRDAGFALCVITRHANNSCTVGYFFGPPAAQLPALPQTLDPADAVVVARFSDLSIVDGTWPFLGMLPSWDRDRWPSTRFFRGDHKAGLAVVYSDDDPSEPIAECKASAEELALPKNDFLGSWYVEDFLSERLRELGF